MESTESNKIWERILHQNKVDEFIQKQNRISEEAYKNMILGTFEKIGPEDKFKQLIHELSITFFNAIKKNPQQNLFSIDYGEVDGLNFTVSEIIYIENTLSKILGFQFKVRNYSNSSQILIKVNTQYIYEWK